MVEGAHCARLYVHICAFFCIGFSLGFYFFILNSFLINISFLVTCSSRELVSTSFHDAIACQAFCMLRQIVTLSYILQINDTLRRAPKIKHHSTFPVKAEVDKPSTAAAAGVGTSLVGDCGLSHSECVMRAQQRLWEAARTGFGRSPPAGVCGVTDSSGLVYHTAAAAAARGREC